MTFSENGIFDLFCGEDQLDKRIRKSRIPRRPDDFYSIGAAAHESASSRVFHRPANVPRFKNRPAPALPLNSLFSTITRPRDSTVSVTPFTRHPS
jgi:hypothetical protein